jgi:EAL domain-containing protein (putative c-di-GMP-specific phosphodiesterase class I)
VRVIAEGIEDLQSLVAVVRLGADYAQGFGVYGSAPIRAWRNSGSGS